MGIYIGIFSILIFFLWFREKIDVNNSYTRTVLALIALLSVSVFSGVRNLYVGIDIGTYGNTIFKSVSSLGLENTMIYYQRWSDVGYVFLNYIVSLFSKSTHILLGVQTFIIELSFFMFFSKFNRKQLSLPLAMGVINIIFIPFSFSMLRQSLAIAVIIWVPLLLGKKKYWQAIVVSILSCTFHKTSLLALAFCLLINYVSKKNKKNSILKINFIAFIIFLSILFVIEVFPQIFSILSEQLSVANFGIGTSLSFLRLLLFLTPILCLKIVNKNKFIKTELEFMLYLFSIIVIIGNFLSGISFGIVRFTLFFLPMYVAFIVLQVGKLEKRINRMFISFICLIWAIFCLYSLFYRGNVGGVFPYVAYWDNYNPSWLNELGGWVDKSKYFDLYNY